MRTFFKLAIVLLLARAAWYAVPIYWNYVRFKDELQTMARFSGEQSDAAIVGRVMEIARDMQVPIEVGQVRVRRERERVHIDASYSEQIEMLPRFPAEWEFIVNVDARTATPTDVTSSGSLSANVVASGVTGQHGAQSRDEFRDIEPSHFNAFVARRRPSDDVYAVAWNSKRRGE